MSTFHKLSLWRTFHPRQWKSTLLALTLILIILGSRIISLTDFGLGPFVTWLLALNTTSLTWIVTRAAGMIGYLLIWLSTVWGLAVSSRILEGRLHGTYTYDFHQFISLLAIGFIVLHLIMLLLDSYTPYSLAQVLVPFLSSYRPLWVAVGILTFYLILLVTITFYIRDRIGQAVFRAIHVVSLLAFIGAAVHGLLAGTDSPLTMVRLMYAGTFLSVVFMMTYWLVLLNQKKQLKKVRAT